MCDRDDPPHVPERLKGPVGVACLEVSRGRAPGHLGNGAGPHEAPLVHDDHLVAGLLDLPEEVAREQDGRPLARETQQRLPHEDDLLGIEAVRRLVEDEQFRLAEQRLSKREPLLHPV